MDISREQAARLAYGDLPCRWSGNDWLAAIAGRARQKLSDHPHGDLPRWLSAVSRLPGGHEIFSVENGVVCLGEAATDAPALRTTLMELHPWRKGPLRLGGEPIDTEWRSDWKWDRIVPHLDLDDRRVLDIGCGNGYFGYRMSAAGASLVVGVDPTLLFVMQWLACRHFAPTVPNYVLPLGVEELPKTGAEFDAVFSMGVLYHRKDPHEHLDRLGSLLRPGGTLVLETLVLPAGREKDLLVPEDRYAAMRNVWAVPGTDRLIGWLRDSVFCEVKLVDVSTTSLEEQRSTDWMQFESLEQALDPHDRRLTREGHPAPVRAALIANRR